MQSVQASGAGAAPPAGGLVVVRHGATEWSESGRHTGRTDLPLLPAGTRAGTAAAELLDPEAFGTVLCSPLRRARETCELAGFGGRAQIVDELREWDYGEYEGLTTPEIRERDPDWSLWRDGCPGGEAPVQVAARADQVLAQVGEGDDDRVRTRAHPARARRALDRDGAGRRGAVRARRGGGVGARIRARDGGPRALEHVS